VRHSESNRSCSYITHIQDVNVDDKLKLKSIVKYMLQAQTDCQKKNPLQIKIHYQKTAKAEANKNIISGDVVRSMDELW